MEFLTPCFNYLASEMEQLKISPATMLEDEITWLDNFEPARAAEHETSEADNILLAGHLRLIKTLLSLCGSEKEMLGKYIFQLWTSSFMVSSSFLTVWGCLCFGSAVCQFRYCLATGSGVPKKLIYLHYL